MILAHLALYSFLDGAGGGTPPPPIPGIAESQAGGGRRRKLKRRATISKTVELLTTKTSEILAGPPPTYAQDILEAGRLLASLDALDNLLVAQDMVLRESLRSSYLRAVAMQDDENILSLLYG